MRYLPFLFLFLLLCSPALAAPTFVQANTGSATGSSVSSVIVTLTNPTTANTLLVGICGWNYDGTQPLLTGVSDGTSNFIHFPNALIFNFTQGLASDAFYLPSANGNQTSFTFSFSPNVTYADCFVFESSGLSVPIPDVAGTTFVQELSTTDTGPTVTPNSANEAIIAVVETQNSISQNPKSGNAFTSGGVNGAEGDAACSLMTTTAGAQTPIWLDSGSSQYITSTVVSFASSSQGVLPVNVKSFNVKSFNAKMY